RRSSRSSASPGSGERPRCSCPTLRSYSSPESRRPKSTTSLMGAIVRLRGAAAPVPLARLRGLPDDGGGGPPYELVRSYLEDRLVVLRAEHAGHFLLKSEGQLVRLHGESAQVVSLFLRLSLQRDLAALPPRANVPRLAALIRIQ